MKRPELAGTTALNEKLSTSEKIAIAGLYRPEDIVFDRAGNLYCGVHTKEDDFNDAHISKYKL